MRTRPRIPPAETLLGLVDASCQLAQYLYDHLPVEPPVAPPLTGLDLMLAYNGAVRLAHQATALASQVLAAATSGVVMSAPRLTRISGWPADYLQPAWGRLWRALDAILAHHGWQELRGAQAVHIASRGVTLHGQLPPGEVLIYFDDPPPPIPLALLGALNHAAELMARVVTGASASAAADTPYPSADSPPEPPPAPLKPKWCAKNKTLWLGNDELKKWSRSAGMVHKVLDTFQKQDWPPSLVVTGLSGKDLTNAIYQLNNTHLKETPLRFRRVAVGRNEVAWQLCPPASETSKTTQRLM